MKMTRIVVDALAGVGLIFALATMRSTPLLNIIAVSIFVALMVVSAVLHTTDFVKRYQTTTRMERGQLLARGLATGFAVACLVLGIITMTNATTHGVERWFMITGIITAVATAIYLGGYLVKFVKGGVKENKQVA